MTQKGTPPRPLLNKVHNLTSKGAKGIFLGLLHSQPFIASNRPKQGIKLGLQLLILATSDPENDKVNFNFMAEFQLKILKLTTFIAK